MDIYIKPTAKNIKLPEYDNRYASFSSFFAAETVVIEPNQSAKVSLGIKVQLPKKFFLLLFPQFSGLIAESQVVECDNFNELSIVFHNPDNQSIVIEKDIRVAIGAIRQKYQVSWRVVDQILTFDERRKINLVVKDE